MPIRNLPLLALITEFGYNDSIKIEKSFEDDQVISHLFREVVHSGNEEILHLSDEKAIGFMDANVSIEADEMLKFSKPVAGSSHLGPPQTSLRFTIFGLDEQSFEGYPPCIVTPYMRNGTMIDFVKTRNGTLPDRRVDQLLFETAQGLAYLHSQNIVHGDLRGGNVLIDDREHAQLADFGLATTAHVARSGRAPDTGRHPFGEKDTAHYVFFSRKIDGTHAPPDTDARAARADAAPRDNDALLDIYAFPEALCVEEDVRAKTPRDIGAGGHLYART
ncbi:kinase-like domain-containing protein [Mycena leptocephala]|nr:kinase-like domain-containing protein [Mycena leptocephala]